MIKDIYKLLDGKTMITDDSNHLECTVDKDKLDTALVKNTTTVTDCEDGYEIEDTINKILDTERFMKYSSRRENFTQINVHVRKN